MLRIPQTFLNIPSLLVSNPSLVDANSRSAGLTRHADKMVKTTYALTLFVAMSLAAPLPPVGNDATSVGHMRRDGTGNLIGAGTADGAVNEMIKGLATPKSDHPDGEDKKGKKAAEIKAAEQKKKEKPVVAHSPLEALPLVGPLLRPVPLVGDQKATL